MLSWTISYTFKKKQAPFEKSSSSVRIFSTVGDSPNGSFRSMLPGGLRFVTIASWPEAKTGTGTFGFHAEGYGSGED